MIVWTANFPKSERPIGYLRMLRARTKFFDYFSLGRSKAGWPSIKKHKGYQSILAGWRNAHQGKRCFIIGNGPSLKKMDLSPLRDEITIGSNGIYKAFGELGFATKYLLFEDVEQTEIRRKEIPWIRGPVKLAGLHNSYAIEAKGRDMIYMNVRWGDGYYWKHMAPMFSEDFSSIVYLGSTVTYIALQLAFHLGCDPVYLIGVDHDYGELPKIFPPGKITITPENYDLVKGLHFKDSYYKIGDQIGVPYVEHQERAYRKAREVYERAGRHVYNAGVDSRLDIFERADFASLFEKGKRP